MSGFRLLIVDDSEYDRVLLHKALERKGGFELVECRDGKQCLEMIHREKVDLILMDIMMPDISGIELLQQIRERFNPIELPIIMITAKSESVDVVNCLQMGANDYITKPVNFEVAVTRISTHLRITALSREMLRLKELSALDAMITTYNHEINNPLAIALGCIDAGMVSKPEGLERLKTALWRIADIVKRIREVTERKEIKYGDYSSKSKLVKIK